ncbi:MAG: hypothetical protein ISS72_02940 [Candidatus Brocadiae bacterium]|nr:hypothetical protein [Candidatus Brocadiia bacterium]
MLQLRRQRAGLRGFSYLEVCLAIVILAICLIPSARMLPTLLAGERGLATRCQLSAVAQEKLESAALSLGNDFAERDEQGDLAAAGHPDWRYHLVVTIPAEGGGRYARLQSRAWLDADGDLACDPEEAQVMFESIASNLRWTASP